MEVWLDVVGFEGLYQVSNIGRVKSIERAGKNGRVYGGNIRTPQMRSNYQAVTLHKNSKYKSYYIHRLVAEAFLPNPDDKPCVNHLNEIKTDNRLENLEWSTYKENLSYNRGQKKRGLKRRNGKQSKKIAQLTMDGSLVKLWPSIGECQRNGFLKACVSSCCRGDSLSHSGYRWAYAV